MGRLKNNPLIGWVHPKSASIKHAQQVKCSIGFNALGTMPNKKKNSDFLFIVPTQ
jgi:hypothetical protein